MSLKYPSANHLHGLDHVITDDDETLVRRLIGKQRHGSDEVKQQLLVILGLEGSETAATPRRKPTPRDATSSHCEKHDTARHYVNGTGWRCRMCHRDNQKKYDKRKRESA